MTLVRIQLPLQQIEIGLRKAWRNDAVSKRRSSFRIPVRTKDLLARISIGFGAGDEPEEPPVFNGRWQSG